MPSSNSSNLSIKSSASGNVPTKGPKVGPKQVLKEMDSSDLDSAKNNPQSDGRNGGNGNVKVLTNKVIPEDQQEALTKVQLTKKEQVIQFLENNYFSTFLTLLTIFALFGDDIRVTALTKDQDVYIYNTLFACFIFFAIELILNVYARPKYFNRGLGFNFYLDLVSTLSVIPDIDWIWSHVIDTTSSSTRSSSAQTALKAGRASRAGSKAGRIVRLVRLFRMLRILRVLKSRNKDVEIKVEISEPSKIGKVLTEKTTRRLIILVLSIIIISPIIDGTVDSTNDDYQISQLERLHRYTQDYNTTGEVSMLHYRTMVENYIRESNGLILTMQMHGIEKKEMQKWLEEIRFQSLDPDTNDWDSTSFFDQEINPKTGWHFSMVLLSDEQNKEEDPLKLYRSNEFLLVENYGCYQNNFCIDCYNEQTNQTNTCHSFVIFDVSKTFENAAKMNIGKTFFVMFCFGISIFFLTRDAELMVIGPIERMMRLVDQLAKNPLGATETKKELYEQEEEEMLLEEKIQKKPEDYETKMLEETLGKIGRLLQVGFGAAGTEIIAKNMGGAGELDVMIPGKKITSIFGFGIIEHFTETCSVLEEDVITYINTIAEIIHRNANIYHGAANKNIGAAFLLAWKICDGTLPGMRDPRDSIDIKRMDLMEKKKKREGIFMRSIGNGKIPRRIGPQELVDSALCAVLKMRVDLHHANHHGNLRKFCTNPKILTAFEDFQVHLGFGLHLGWAIEGAIGSKYKIDASYLSPNVNMAARLEAATGQFDVPMLISEWFVEELSPEAKQMCRKIDRVMVKGSEIPMDLWTFDIGHYPPNENLLLPIIQKDGKQKPVEFGKDSIFTILQENIPKAFFDAFHLGINEYFNGNWQNAHINLTQANQFWEDGPTKVILKVIEKESQGTLLAPNWWKGYRQLTEK